MRYLLVQRADDPTRAQRSACWPHCVANVGLRHELLEVRTPFPPRLRLLLAEQLVVRNGVKQPLARLFEIAAGGAVSGAQGLPKRERSVATVIQREREARQTGMGIKRFELIGAPFGVVQGRRRLPVA